MLYDQIKVKAQGWAYVLAWAQLALDEWNNSTQDVIKLARFAAECARAINLGREWSRDQLKKEFEGSFRVQMMKKDPNPESISTTIKVIEYLFSPDYLMRANTTRAEPANTKEQLVIAEYAC